MKHTHNIILTTVKKLWSFVCLMSVSLVAFSENTQTIIPLSTDEAPKDGTSMFASVMNVFQKDIAPILEVGGVILIMFVLLTGIMRIWSDYQVDKDAGKVKQGIVVQILLVVILGMLLYLIEQARVMKFA